jgi:hypothetical protein
MDVIQRIIIMDVIILSTTIIVHQFLYICEQSFAFLVAKCICVIFLLLKYQLVFACFHDLTDYDFK